MNALVTGATGFLGYHLALRLKEEGLKVRATGRNLMEGNDLSKQNIEFIPLDLTNKELVQDLCTNQDLVFHCAGHVAPWGRWEDFRKSNIFATQNLLDASKKKKVHRFIHVSTPSIYFDYSDRLNIRESDPLPPNPVNAYAATKLQAEKEVLESWKEGLPIIMIRPSAIFGPGDTTILPRMIRANQEGGVPWIREGKAMVDFTYIDNVVDSLLCCMRAKDSVLGKAYNISNGDPRPFSDIVELLFQKLDEPLHKRPMPYSAAFLIAYGMELYSKITKKEPPFTRYSLGFISLSRTLDISLANEELDYHPRISLDEGIGKFAQWWKNDH